mmetsp:Transcript_12877/g.36911  ORF Transcript_12877/g.36911 Transcript_12877/m.36911 type:complete len:342 (+) Transcript_12877:6421-7446(+)
MGHVLFGGSLLDPVAEVHHVPDVVVLGGLDGLEHALGDEVLVAEEDAGVHVALVGELVPAGAVDALGHVDRVAEGDDIGVALGHALDEGAAVGDVEDDGQVGALLLGLLDDVGKIWAREDVKVARGELGSPGVEDLDGLGAVVRLVLDVGDHGVGELLQQAVEHVGVAEHELLDVRVVLAHASLDDVGGQGEGGANKAEHGRLTAANFLPEPAEGLADVGDAVLRVELGDRIDLLLGPDGVEDNGPLAGQDVKRDVHAGDRGENVREQNDAVRLEGPPRLKRDLDGEVGVLGALPEGLVDLAHVLIHLHVPARLPHHPHGRPLDLFTAKRAKEEGILRLGG